MEKHNSINIPFKDNWANKGRFGDSDELVLDAEVLEKIIQKHKDEKGKAQEREKTKKEAPVRTPPS